MEARIRLSAKNLNRKHMVISQASDYYDYSFQKQKQQPKLLDSVKKQKLDFEAFAEGYADDDTNIFASGLINIDEIYDETDKIKQENKFLMSKLMDHESERSKIASLNAEIQNAAKKNKELMIESKQLSKSFMLDRDDLAINPSMNTNIITMNKYERWLHKIQTQFKILQEEIKEREGNIDKLINLYLLILNDKLL